MNITKTSLFGHSQSKDGGSPRRHPALQGQDLITGLDPNISTLYDHFMYCVYKYASNRFLGIRIKNKDGSYGDYAWKTYSEILARVIHFASGLCHLGHKTYDKIGIYSMNRPEWTIVENACYRMNYIVVPIYHTLGIEDIVYILNLTELETIVTTSDHLPILFELKSKVPSLKNIICMDTYDQQFEKDALCMHLNLWAFESVEKKGEDVAVIESPPKPNDLYTICFTSGSTGSPKGVMLTHSGMISMLATFKFNSVYRLGHEVSEKTVYFSYLPLAHIFERICFPGIMFMGGSIGLYHGEIERILDDIQHLKPNLLVSVPRILNRIYDKVNSEINKKPFIQRNLFKLAYNVKLKCLDYSNSYHSIYDHLAFSKIRNLFGGNLQSILTGSAPLNKEVLNFFRVCFSCEVYQGYGLTETNGAGACTIRNDHTVDHVGSPVVTIEIKLIDVPEMEYFTTDKPNPRGEICIKGSCCFIGYYKDEMTTKEALDHEGWVHTGDVGMWNDLGHLVIIDRKKNIFKLSQGEYIAPEKVETALSQFPLIKQIFVHGNSLKDYLVAIIVLEEEPISNWLKGVQIKDTPRNRNQNPILKNAFITELIRFAKDKTLLKGFEIPRDVYFESVPFSIQNNLISATFKLKRSVAIKKYGAVIEGLYSGGAQ